MESTGAELHIRKNGIAYTSVPKDMPGIFYHSKMTEF